MSKDWRNSSAVTRAFSRAPGSKGSFESPKSCATAFGERAEGLRGHTRYAQLCNPRCAGQRIV